MLIGEEKFKDVPLSDVRHDYNRSSSAFYHHPNVRVRKKRESTIPETKASDQAALMDITGGKGGVGGINLNPALLDLQIKRDGNGIPLPINQQPIGNMKIEGFIPVIINVTPVNLPLLLGVNYKKASPAPTDSFGI